MAKRKTGNKKPGAGNPNPIQTPEFKKRQIKPMGKIPGDYPLGKKVWGIRLPEDVEEFLKQWDEEDRPGRVEWMRTLLTCDAREKMNEQQ